MNTFRSFCVGVGLAISFGAIVFAQTTLQLGSTIGVEAGEFSSNFRGGVAFDSGLSLSTSVSVKGTEFVSKTMKLGVDLDRFDFSAVAGLNKQGLKQATYKSNWRLADMLQMISSGTIDRDGLDKATLSVKESSTGYNLSLNTMWGKNKFRDFSVSAKRNLNQYTLSALFTDLATESPYLDATIKTLFSATNFSWNFHLDPSGFHQQTFGAYYDINDFKTSTLVTFDEEGFDSGKMVLELDRDILKFVNTAHFDLNFITKNIFTFNFSNKMATAKGTLTFGRKGVMDGVLEAQTDITEDVDLTAKVEMAENGFKKAALGTQTTLGENIKTRILFNFIDKGFTNGSVRFSYPWKNYTIASTTGFNKGGFRSQEISIDTDYEF